MALPLAMLKTEVFSPVSSWDTYVSTLNRVSAPRLMTSSFTNLNLHLESARV